jgi:hypothetical protein
MTKNFRDAYLLRNLIRLKRGVGYLSSLGYLSQFITQFKPPHVEADVVSVVLEIVC